MKGQSYFWFTPPQVPDGKPLAARGTDQSCRVLLSKNRHRKCLAAAANTGVKAKRYPVCEGPLLGSNASRLREARSSSGMIASRR